MTKKSNLLRLLLILACLCTAAGAEGDRKYQLNHGGKSLRLSVLALEGGDYVALKGPAEFLGMKTAWDDGGSLLMSSSQGRWLLPPDQAFAYRLGSGKERLVLPAAMTVTAAGPALTAGSLKMLLPFLGFQDATLGPETQVVQAPEKMPSIGTIVIDPGHGGYDSGAIGRQHRTYEKDACLDIAQRLAALLRQSGGHLKVVLTRDRDEFISLEDRTHLANRLKADLFISIHNNSSNDSDSHGTQVFYYDSQSSSREAAGLARRENSNANFLEMLFRDLRKLGVRDPSIRLASSVEREITRSLDLKGRRLQYAPFYVLAMTKMPAILVETAFISNAREEKLLRTPAFRQQVAEAIFDGVRKYGLQVAKN